MHSTLLRMMVMMFALVPCCTGARAMASNRDVPLDDPVYRTIDAAVARGEIRAIHYGQRPWSAAYIARLLAEAAHHTGDAPPPRPRGFTTTAPRVRLDAGGSTSEASVTPVQNSQGTITLSASPFDVFREGRDTPGGGAGLFLEAYQSASIGSWISAALAPRAWAEFGTSGRSASAHATLWEALLKIGPPHLEVSVGRGRVLWGPAEHGGLLLTDQAPPLDMLRVHTPLPFRLPWVFRHIGTLQGGLLFATLGNRYTPADTILTGYRVDIQPHPWVTAGLSHMVMLGGHGLPGPGVGEAITEFIGFVRPGHGNAASNHQATVDLHLRFPPWRGTQLYAAYAYEDPDSALEIQFDKQAAWMLGVYLPRLTSDGRWRLRAEYWRAGAGMYRHGAYSDGWTLQGHGLGSPFGGDSNAAWVTVTHDLATPHAAVEGRVGVIQRSSNTYTNLTNAAGDRIAIVEATNGPEEVNVFARGEIRLPLGHHLTGTGAAGYAQVWNHRFVAGARQHQGMVAVTLAWQPAWSFTPHPRAGRSAAP